MGIHANPETNAADCRLILDSLATQNADYDVDTHGTNPGSWRVSSHRKWRRYQKNLERHSVLAPFAEAETDGLNVFAVRNKSVASEVGHHWPVWPIPISLTEVLPLVDLSGNLLTD